MMLRFLLTLVLSVFAIFALAPAAQAQQDEEKSRFVRYVEEQLSSDNFQIKLNGLEGTLSSNVTLGSITIADRKGVWLTINQPQLVWNRSALLGGRVEIESLTAQTIDMPRGPLPDDSLPNAEATPFALPDLPVAILVEKLEVGRISFGEAVFGLAAVANLTGRIVLDDGALDTKLDITRLGGPGGKLDLTAKLDASQQLALNLNLQEPQNGIVANLLNIEGKPPVSLAVVGNAPLSALQVNLALDVAERRILDGFLQRQVAAGDTVTVVSVNGPLASILPADVQPFFGTQTVLGARLRQTADGETLVEFVNLDSGEVQLTASGRLLADGFLQALNVDFRLEPPAVNAGAQITLPGVEPVTTLAGAQMLVDYDAERAESWTGQIRAQNITRSDLSVEDMSINARGTVANVQRPVDRSIAFTVDGGLRGFQAEDPAVTEALGRALSLSGQGAWQAGQPLWLQNFRLAGEPFIATLSGALQKMVFTGDFTLDANRLASFAALLERPLRGRLQARASGDVMLTSGGFDLRLNGTGENLAIGEKAIDRLLQTTTTLSGGVARDENGLKFDGLRVANRDFSADVDGFYTSNAADLTAKTQLRDLAVVSDDGAGALSADVQLVGQTRPLSLKASVALPEGRLMRRAVSNLALGFDGVVDEGLIEGDLSARGRLNGKPVQLSGDVKATENQQIVQNLAARVGDASLSGTAIRNGAGLIDGIISLDASDVSDAAALALVDAQGAAKGTIVLRAEGDRQDAVVDLQLNDVAYQNKRIGTATLEANAVDLFGTPAINAKLDGRRIEAGGVQVRVLDADIQTQGTTSAFSASAQLVQNEAAIETRGTVEQGNGNTTVRLASLGITSNIANARLQQPTTITVDGVETRLDNTVLQVGGGLLRVRGSVGPSLDFTVTAERLPLSIVNSVRPDLGAGGVLSGQARITGTPAVPDVQFSADGAGLTAAPLDQNGISPLTLSASGQFFNNIVELTALNVRNGQGINASASGRVPVSGPGLAVRAQGTAPLSIAEPFLAARGTDIEGTARFDATLRGSISAPQASGLFSLQGASVSDPLSNLRLTQIDLIAGLQGDRITISRGSAQLATGGSVSLSGSVGLGATLPANLTIALNSARYTDAETFDTRASGQLTVTGALLADPLLAGTIDLERTEITVPENFPGSDDLLAVDHVRPDTATQRTLLRLAKVQPTGGKPTSRPSVLRLNVTVRAPNQIFVRGRGLDAELGGQIRVVGPVTNIEPEGRFELRRGRLSILGQRIDLVEGTISLTGTMDPLLDFTARTQAGDVEAFIIIRGRASDLDISFTSNPELPQDEVLARIIFGRGLGDLSPAQIARLASIAGELTGGKSPGLIDSLRAGTGLDDLDVVQDADGNTAVRAGKYIRDNVYLGVQAGQTSEATINLDVTDNVTVRGAVSSEGNTSLGVFLEKDY
ncbi:MAG: translocation/assembly module TamB domain-containing protein [Pseudomonadota bacterium]